ncbi:methyltransferase like 6 [Angomonas deanei]|nr:methyltransferase like 6 [Angomonas deanei]|eukprot:EPY27468.1 methyltransferase like 6 [Angomonas deanei]
MSEEAVHKPKTRGGGVFTPAKDVKLHANDFEFAEKVASLEPGDKKILEDYKALMLRGLNGGTVPPSAESQREEKPGEGEPWENHYKQSRHHFPLKNYIIHAFPILGELLRSEEKRYILECGCGTGSTLLPLILEFPESKATFVGFDISETALKYFSENPTAEKLIGESRLHLFPYDVSRPSEESGENCKRRKMEGEVEENVVVKNVPTLAGTKFDAVLLVFVLSALDHIGNMVLALERLSSLLKPGGVILFRDYAVADHNFFGFLR